MTTGHCADRNGVAIGVYVYSAVNLALDWYYALALAPMVWKLQMRTMVKISTVFVLGMGVLYVIPSPRSIHADLLQRKYREHHPFQKSHWLRRTD